MKPAHTGRRQRSSAYRGVSLLQTITAIGVSALLLSLCVPLFLEAQRQADIGLARARMDSEAREIATRFREDIRQARTVAVSGSTLRVNLTRGGEPVSIRYEPAPGGWLREARDRTGNVVERFVYEMPPGSVRFREEGRTVHAEIRFQQTVHRREQRLALDVSAVPRREP